MSWDITGIVPVLRGESTSFRRGRGTILTGGGGGERAKTNGYLSFITWLEVLFRKLWAKRNTQREVFKFHPPNISYHNRELYGIYLIWLVGLRFLEDSGGRTAGKKKKMFAEIPAFLFIHPQNWGGGGSMNWYACTQVQVPRVLSSIFQYHL
jgi:hypothetical protein